MATIRPHSNTKIQQLLWLTGSNLLFAVSAYGMGKECQKSSSLLLASLILVTCYDGHPKVLPTWAKMLH